VEAASSFEASINIYRVKGAISQNTWPFINTVVRNLTSKSKTDIIMKVILHDGHAYRESKSTQNFHVISPLKNYAKLHHV